jgi:hypothetical protein
MPWKAERYGSMEYSAGVLSGERALRMPTSRNRSLP